jgi:hypothetical protein
MGRRGDAEAEVCFARYVEEIPGDAARRSRLRSALHDRLETLPEALGETARPERGVRIERSVQYGGLACRRCGTAYEVESHPDGRLIVELPDDTEQRCPVLPSFSFRIVNLYEED